MTPPSESITIRTFGIPVGEDGSFRPEAATLGDRRALLEFFAGLAQAGGRLDENGETSVAGMNAALRGRFNQLLYTGAPAATGGEPLSVRWTTSGDAVRVCFTGPRSEFATAHEFPLARVDTRR